jgi:hypothetical protein
MAHYVTITLVAFSVQLNIGHPLTTHLVQVCILADDKGIFSSQLQRHWGQPLSSSSHHFLAHLGAAHKHHLHNKDITGSQKGSSTRSQQCGLCY